MRNFIVLTCVGVTLSACAGSYTHQANNQLQAAFQRERNAWAQTQKTYETSCEHSTDNAPLPQGKAVESAECYEAIAKQHVMPVAINPHLVNELLAEYMQNAIHYKKGMIDRDQVNLNMQKSWNAYVQKIDAKGDQALVQALQADQVAAQNRQQALQKLSTELLQDPPAPKTTRCSVFAGTMTCTEM